MECMPVEHDESNFGSTSSDQPLSFSTGLYSLKRQIRNESAVCWLLVGLAALVSWSLGPILAGIFGAVLGFAPALLQSGFSNPDQLQGIYALQNVVSGGYRSRT